MAAVGVPLADRGTRTDEYLDAMTSLWTDPAPRFHGRYVDFADIDAHPRPAGIRVVRGRPQPGRLPAGGRPRHGFYGNGTPEDIAGDLDGLRRPPSDTGRPARLGRLEITAMPLVPLDRATVARYAELGVDRLVLRPEAWEPGCRATRTGRPLLERHAHLGGARWSGGRWAWECRESHVQDAPALNVAFRTTRAARVRRRRGSASPSAA